MANSGIAPLNLVLVAALTIVLISSLFQGNHQAFAHNSTPNIEEDSLMVTAAPSSVSRGGTVTITATVLAHRTGPGTDTDWTVELTVPAGYTISSGANPQSKSTSSHGSALANWNVTAPATPSGPDTFTVTASATDASSGNPLSGSPEIDTFSVTTVNNSPIATNDSGSTLEDSGVVISVLTNDSDSDNDSLVISSLPAAPSNGTAVIDAGNTTITYTPLADFFGTDAFSYSVQDGFGGSDMASVTLTITAVNDAPSANNDTDSVAEDASVSVTVLANDTDIENDTLSVSSVSAPQNGTTFINPDNTITYSPDADFNGADIFVYVVSDGNGGTESATVSIAVTPANDAPVAYNSSTTVDEDNQITVALEGSDIDGDILTFIVVAPPLHGTLAGFDPSTGAGTYVPEANFNGQDSFEFIITDNSVNSTSAMVSITVSPVAEEDDAQPDQSDRDDRRKENGGGRDSDRKVYDEASFVKDTVSRIQVRSFYLQDSEGNAISEVKLGQAVDVHATIRNYQNVDQPYVFVVQILSTDNVAVAILYTLGAVEDAGAAKLSLPWTPDQTGSYMVEMMILDGFSDPTSLTDISTSALSVRERPAITTAF